MTRGTGAQCCRPRRAPRIRSRLLSRWQIFRTGAGWRIGLALAASAMLVAACSGDDDDSGDGDGAGDGGGNGDGSSFEVGTDEEYVEALCTSFVSFTEEFFTAAI